MKDEKRKNWVKTTDEQNEKKKQIVQKVHYFNELIRQFATMEFPVNSTRRQFIIQLPRESRIRINKCESIFFPVGGATAFFFSLLLCLFWRLEHKTFLCFVLYMLSKKKNG